MFYPKLRHAPSKSIIDISPIQHAQNPSFHYSPTSVSKSSHNQNRVLSHHHHHQLCHSDSDDSLDKEFIQNTKQTVNKLFLQTNFTRTLDQIQHTLQPVVEQFRQEIQRKKYLSKRDRIICLKSCAKLITNTLLNEQWDSDDSFPELYRLQYILNRFLSNQRTNISVQTSEQLETDMRQLHIDNTIAKHSEELQPHPIQKLTQPSKVSVVSTDERPTSPIQPIDNLTQQKDYHRSVSRAFKLLKSELQKMNHETPFKAHLSKYHKHNHE